MIKNTIKSRQQIIPACEIFFPCSRLFVAGKDHRFGSFLLITSVDHIKEHIGILLIEGTSAYFIDDQAGRLHRVATTRGALPRSAALWNLSLSSLAFT